MLNLLPKDQKNKIVGEYRTRFLIVAFSLSLVAEIISLVLLTPSFLTAEIRTETLNNQSAGTKAKNLTNEIASLEATVKQTNTYLSTFATSSTSTDIVGMIKNIVDIRAKTVKLNSFLYKVQDKQQQIVVSGLANSRQDLLDFTQKIKNLPGVVSSDLPISNFAESQNINFSITIVVKP